MNAVSRLLQKENNCSVFAYKGSADKPLLFTNTCNIIPYCWYQM